MWFDDEFQGVLGYYCEARMTPWGPVEEWWVLTTAPRWYYCERKWDGFKKEWYLTYGWERSCEPDFLRPTIACCRTVAVDTGGVVSEMYNGEEPEPPHWKTRLPPPFYGEQDLSFVAWTVVALAVWGFYLLATINGW